jgi:hypothetical protein
VDINQFVAENDGRFVEVAGSPDAKFQCVDGANAYIRDVLGQPIVEHTNADDFPSKCMAFCDWIPYQHGMTGEKGDIVILDMGSYGHIAEFLDGNSLAFNSFDENYPLGTPCHIQKHNYINVTGFLRPHKGDDMSKEDLFKLIYRATQGREPTAQELGYVIGLSQDDLINLRFRDDVIAGYWKASNGDDCPTSESNYWQMVIQKGEANIGDLQNTWYKDHKNKPKDCATEVATAVKDATETMQDELKTMQNEMKLEMDEHEEFTKAAAAEMEKRDVEIGKLTNQVADMVYPKDCPTVTVTSPPDDKCNWFCKLFGCCK